MDWMGQHDKGNFRQMRSSIGAAFLVAGIAGGYISAMQALSRAGTLPAADGSKWVQEMVNPKDAYSIYALGHFKSEGTLSPPRGAQLYSRLTDDDGKALRGDCSYRLTGPAIAARWWALNAVAIGAPNQVASSSAADTLITGDDRLDIGLSRHAMPGNWLIVPDATNLKVTLSIFEASDKAKNGTVNLPTLSKVSCE